MEIRNSARKHGIADDDIMHAVTWAIRVLRDDEGFTMVIGADRAGNLLEVGIGTHGDIVHAMPARSKFLPRKG